MAKYNSSLNTPAGCRGHKFKSIGKLSNSWTDWHQIWYTSADSSGNGHRLNTTRPQYPRGIWRAVRGSQIQMFGEAIKRLDRLAPTLVHVCGFIWEWTQAKSKSPLNTPGGIWGGREGVTDSKVWGSCQTAASIGTKFGTCQRIRLGMDIG